MKDLGEMEYCLGIKDHSVGIVEVHTWNIVTFWQTINQFHTTRCQCQVFYNSKWHDARRIQDNVRDPLSKGVGKFMFAMIATRLDLTMVVGVVNPFMHKPQMDHWQAIKRILRYLHGTKDYWLQYNGHGWHGHLGILWCM
jgi:hypothetical protein